MRLKDRVAIVTGGSTGIGFAIARRLSEEGAAVVIADIKGAAEAAAGLSGSNRQIAAAETDVASEDSVAQLISGTIDRLGRIDILVNNAAVSASLALTPFEKLTVAKWRHVLDVNAIGTFLCCRAVAPHMRAQKSGRDRQHRLRHRLQGRAVPAALRGQQRRGDLDDALAGARARQRQHHSECRLARLHVERRQSGEPRLPGRSGGRRRPPSWPATTPPS
jgi:NAD(P)-dependent dehydrogenase (short-subunit alcohol dehydrogenase family)